MSDELVLSLRGLSYYRHWTRTLRQARHRLPNESRVVDRLQVRLQSLAGMSRPIFILGCPRSGTSYLGSILAELPSVSYFYEPPIMKYYTRLVYEGLVSESSAMRFYRWGCRALMMAAPGSGPRMIEKNPNHTFIARTLYQAFPDAQFLVITRDGRDVCASLSEKPWHLRQSLFSGKREPGGYLYGPYPHFYIERSRAVEYEQTSDIHRCIWIWRRYAEQIESLHQQLPKLSQFHFRYEDLVGQPEATVGRILDFLGENNAASTEAVIAAAGSGHKASVGRWEKVLSHDQMSVVEREAGQMLRQLGYVYSSTKRP